MSCSPTPVRFAYLETSQNTGGKPVDIISLSLSIYIYRERDMYRHIVVHVYVCMHIYIYIYIYTHTYIVCSSLLISGGKQLFHHAKNRGPPGRDIDSI